MEALGEALQEAIEERNALQILKLLDIDMKPLDKDREGNTVLHHIINNERLPEKMVTKILKILLNDGIDPNTKNSRGETALHLAVAKRMNDAIDILIKYNAMINACGRSFITHYFVEDENKKFWQIADNDEREVAEVQTATFVDWLISRGFDFHTKDDEKEESAFNLAEEKCLLHVLTAVLLNTKGIKFNRHIEYRNEKLFEEPLFADGWMHLQSCPDPDWYRDYRLRHATSIVKNLLDVTGPTERERSLLLDVALWSEEPSVVELLTNHFPAGCDERKFATIMFCRIMRRLKIHNDSPAELRTMSDLIGRGADVNSDASDVCGRTPLHRAVDAKNIRVVKFLKDNNADFLVVDALGSNLLHRLAEKCVPRIGIHKEVDELLDLLVSEGVEVNARNRLCRTPLRVAVDNHNWMIARGLIFHGAEVDDITGVGRQFCERFSQDIRVLKDTFVDGRTSLYRLLRMQPNERYVYANNDNFKRIADSPELKMQFREYSSRILSACEEAKERYWLVVRAKEAWLELTEIDLLYECIERIFVYLSNKDLYAIIKK